MTIYLYLLNFKITIVIFSSNLYLHITLFYFEYKLPAWVQGIFAQFCGVDIVNLRKSTPVNH